MQSNQFQTSTVGSMKSLESVVIESSTKSSSTTIRSKCPQTYPNTSNWTLAGILGLVTTGALLLGLLGGDKTDTLLLAGTCALLAGGLSIALAEWVSARDSDFESDKDYKDGLQSQLEFEELRREYISKGLTPQLAHQVALELSGKLDERAGSNEGEHHDFTLQSCVASALAFVLGGFAPLLVVILTRNNRAAGIIGVLLTCWVLFFTFGALLGHFKGYSKVKKAMNVAFGGTLVLGLSYGIGLLFNQTN
jgi:VIT1/CCC1 family predicted Fe2+/Mn2+ transporter